MNVTQGDGLGREDDAYRLAREAGGRDRGVCSCLSSREKAAKRRLASGGRFGGEPPTKASTSKSGCPPPLRRLETRAQINE